MKTLLWHDCNVFLLPWRDKINIDRVTGGHIRGQGSNCQKAIRSNISVDSLPPRTIIDSQRYMPKHSTSVFEFKSSSEWLTESMTNGKLGKRKKNRNNNWLVLFLYQTQARRFQLLTFPICRGRAESTTNIFPSGIYAVLANVCQKCSIRYLHGVGRYCSQKNIFQSQMTTPQISFS